jgi:release factor H-coupled RctB family protein
MCTNTSSADLLIIASKNTWIDTEAIQQLQTTAQLKGMCKVVGLPDLHPGRGYPIGAAFITKSWIYPQLVGGDIGCGMAVWQTDIPAHKLKLDSWVSKLRDLDHPWQGDVTKVLADNHLGSTPFDASLGTIGGGNHFAELQKIESIVDNETFESLGLSSKHLYLTVHSGSRGLGGSILQSFTASHCHDGVADDSVVAKNYLTQHDMAVRWAQVNRDLIAERFLECLRASGQRVLDIFHNTVSPYIYEGQNAWIHRKGATPSDQGIVIIPGSRGSFSYLVLPTEAQDYNANSLAHGAGRKWKRTEAKSKLSNFRAEDLTRTDLGSRVICEDKYLLFEEAPNAYKRIDSVINDLVDAGLIKVLAILRPVITYKTRSHA